MQWIPVGIGVRTCLHTEQSGGYLFDGVDWRAGHQFKPSDLNAQVIRLECPSHVKAPGSGCNMALQR